MATDFVVINPLDGTKADVQAIIKHTTKRVRILNPTRHPTRDWDTQQAHNLLIDLKDTGARARFLIHDRDSNSHAGLGTVSTAAEIDVIRTGIAHHTRTRSWNAGSAPSTKPLPDNMINLNTAHRHRTTGGALRETTFSRKAKTTIRRPW